MKKSYRNYKICYEITNIFFQRLNFLMNILVSLLISILGQNRALLDRSIRFGTVVVLTLENQKLIGAKKYFQNGRQKSKMAAKNQLFF